MGRDLHDAVVVVTGASSGIGRATARRFAAEGARVMLLARGTFALEEAATDVRAHGGTAETWSVDVRRAEAVQKTARGIVARHGRIDVWVNNAGVSAFGRLEEIPLEAQHQVIETNLLGVLHGSRAAVEVMRPSGRGVIVNVSSVVGEIPLPFHAAYTASKAAIRGLSGALRGELAGSGVHVSTIMPAVIDTPIWQHAANWSGRRIIAGRPRVPPDRVARAIVRAARRHPRERVVGMQGRLAVLQHRLVPGLIERLAVGQAHRVFADEPAPLSTGNLFVPSGDPHTPEGGWRERPAGHRAIAAAAGLALGVGGVQVWRRTR